MRTLRLHLRSLAYHRRANIAVVMGVTVGTATLTGALLVGDSMKGSLRDAALSRLGRIEWALSGGRFFRTALASEIADANAFAPHFERACPAILLRGAITHADTRARVNRIQVLGVNDQFWTLDNPARTSDDNIAPPGRTVVLNRALAGDLGAEVGDDVLIRFEKPSAAPAETLLGRRDDRTVALRLSVLRIDSSGGLADFTLAYGPRVPRNAFVPLELLQRTLKQPGRANAILVSAKDGAARPPDGVDLLQHLLGEHLTPADAGLTIRPSDPGTYFDLQSRRLLIEPALAEAAAQAARAIDAPTAPTLVYLANTISATGHETAATDGADARAAATIPYSTVAALDPQALANVSPLVMTDGTSASTLADDEILLNAWVAAELGARVGDTVELTYYVTAPFGRLETDRASFRLAGVVRMTGPGCDPALTPEYPGITDASNLADWNPPFPFDHGSIHPRDEAYWDEHRAAPKAFVSLATGRNLWASAGDRFGRLTSIRVGSSGATDAAATASAFERALMERLPPERLGLVFESARQKALDAGLGSTDFAGLFVGFSSFLIFAAALMVALIFRLDIERRSAEFGLLSAVGFTPRRIIGLLLTQGAVLSAVGAALGTAASIAYARLMLAGLRSGWNESAGESFLRLHVSAVTLAAGLAGGVLIALFSIWLSARSLGRMPPRALLAGAIQAGSPLGKPRPGRDRRIAWGSFALAGLLLLASALSDNLPLAGMFFAVGALTLVGFLAALSHGLKSGAGPPITPSGNRAVFRLGLRNTTRNRRRSLSTVALIASAVFVIVAVGASRHQVSGNIYARDSGTGGFTLLAEAAIPLQADPNSPEGRETLNLFRGDPDAPTELTFTPMRLRPGDEASCLNLFRPARPRILGAPDAFLERGAFAFKSSLAETPQEKRNPWTLLRRTLPDGAVPVIGDYSAVMWILHLGLGKDLVIRDERGRDVALRVVGMLSGSVLQGELVTSEAHFAELFPSTNGYAFFLIEAPPPSIAATAAKLEAQLADYGFDVVPTAERLAEYLAIENTYMATFQILGGFGLILGTLGLAAVLLRNVFERRAELALLRAVGYRRASLAILVLSENGALLSAGLLAGSLSALLAVAPNAWSHPEVIPWASLAGTLVIVFLTGMLAGAVALVPALRAPLVPALRAE